MLTTQTNIALQLVATLSESELEDFAKEFQKFCKPVAVKKPRKQNLLNLPDAHVLAYQLLVKHRAKHGIPTQVNLHNSLDVAG